MNLTKLIFNLGYLFSYAISGGSDVLPLRDCETCLARQRNGENIACPYDCNQLLIDPLYPPCELCPPDPPCPPPGPDCEYEQHRDNCGCSYGCGNIVCNPTITIPPSPPNPCPIEQVDCINEFVCPKVTEVTQCSHGGIEGHTTYQLSLVVQPDKYINRETYPYPKRQQMKNSVKYKGVNQTILFVESTTFWFIGPCGRLFVFLRQKIIFFCPGISDELSAFNSIDLVGEASSSLHSINRS